MNAERDEDVKGELNGQTEVDNNIASSSALVSENQNCANNGKQIRSCGTKIGVNIDQALEEIVSAVEEGVDEAEVGRNVGKVTDENVVTVDTTNDNRATLAMNLNENVLEKRLSSTATDDTIKQTCEVWSEPSVEDKSSRENNHYLSECATNGKIDPNVLSVIDENDDLKPKANRNPPGILVERLPSSAMNEMLTQDNNNALPYVNAGGIPRKESVVSNISQEENVSPNRSLEEAAPETSLSIVITSGEAQVLVRRLSSELAQELGAEENVVTDNSAHEDQESLAMNGRNYVSSPVVFERRLSSRGSDQVVNQSEEISSGTPAENSLSAELNRNSSEDVSNQAPNDVAPSAMDESNTSDTEMNASLPVVLVERLSPSAINEILNRESNNTYESDNGDDVSMAESDNDSFDLGRLLAEESFTLARMLVGTDTDTDTDTILSSQVGQVMPREGPPSSEFDQDLDRYRDEEMYQENRTEEAPAINRGNDVAAVVSEEDGDEEEMAVSDEAESSFVFPNITSSEDNDDEDIEDEISHDEDAWSINGDVVALRQRETPEIATYRRLIDQTRRSIAYVAASIQPSADVGPSELVRRDSFMQRFRRILFILSSRQRRLIRLGLASPDVENPEGEAGAEELSDGPNNTALERIVQNLGLGLNHLNDIEQLTSSVATPSQQRQEEIPENAVRFDTNLPAEHSYMGSNMNRVSGVNYLEVDQHYHMTLFMHQHILFPGEILPFMISGSIIDGDIDAQNGFLFGVCFPVLDLSAENLYGVTCQIYEKGTDDRGNTLIKSRALQRFVIKTDDLFGPLEYINDHPQMKCYGNVKILPDIYLPEPLKCINMGSMSRFRDNDSMKTVYKRYQVATAPWPAHVYDQYSIASIIEKARTQLAQHKIHTMPTDPTQLSYWLVRNLHLSENLMHSIFLTNSVNTRLRMIANTFKEEYIFSCRYCSSHIANCRELFAMSKHGVQTQYCNSAGYVHETNTVYQVNNQAILYSGSPSAEFSWFPGYQWHSIVCKVCKHHLGWEFKAVEPNLVPKQFFGISSSSVRVRPTQSGRNESRIRSIMRLNTMPMIGSDNDRDVGAGGGDTE
uniref:Protein cereblon n=1 Tax=Glossina brevipalpis TaxID=37001 RepID=A0A1A9X412_9MUSC